MTEARRYQLMTPTSELTRETIHATVIRNENQPDECTLHPATPAEGERTTAWITAKEGSFVQLASCQ